MMGYLGIDNLNPDFSGLELILNKKKLNTTTIRILSTKTYFNMPSNSFSYEPQIEN